MKFSGISASVIALFSLSISAQVADASLSKLRSETAYDVQGTHSWVSALSSGLANGMEQSLQPHGARFSGINGLIQVADAEDTSTDDPSNSAQNPNAEPAKMPDIGGAGTLDQTYNLDLPKFRGLEPNIALNYSSSRKTRLGGLYQGWLGYGWGLSGFDVIERTRQKGGIPSFDNTIDTFALNGEELIACASDNQIANEVVASGDSASCAAGGTHVTENENYLKIVHKGGAASGNAWVLTKRDGTEIVLAAVGDLDSYVAGSGDNRLAYKARWLIQTVTDVHGNVVTYSYDCPTIPVCYPSKIAYNGTVVRFYMGDRSDYMSMANGVGLSVVTRQLNVISVTTSGTMVLAWSLQYKPEADLKTSRLTRILRYGSDAVITSGAVSSGTSMPPTAFTYANYSGFSALEAVSGLKGDGQTIPVDVDGDGVSEIMSIHTTNSDCSYNLYYTPLLDGELQKQALSIPCRFDGSIGHGANVER